MHNRFLVFILPTIKRIIYDFLSPYSEEDSLGEIMSFSPRNLLRNSLDEFISFIAPELVKINNFSL